MSRGDDRDLSDLRAAPLGELAATVNADHLFAAWLRSRPVPGGQPATTELAAALGADAPFKRSPLQEAPAFAERFPTVAGQTARGPAVVVTGQQPGFLGGPLLTLYKIATAVVLAERRSAAGRPTVPVFWSGDDDDDLAEALSPVGWCPATNETVGSPARDRLRRPETARAVLAHCGPEVWAAGLDTALPGTGGDGCASTVLRAAGRDGLTWGDAQVRLLETVFAGTGLVIVRGHDPRLHAAAAPLYERILARREELAAATAARGLELEAAGYHAQIASRSLSRPLFTVEDGRRHPLVHSRRTDWSGVDAAELRPGVMVRSPVQDWLLQPVAVVVGPGELAYLRQLDPVYAALGVPRSPLVPRLTGWLLPAGRTAREAARPVPADRQEAGRWADAIADQAARAIRARLTGELKIDGVRASRLAADRARRFRRGLAAMFAGEVRQQRQTGPPGLPCWVRPDGRRQERRLGMLAALAWWGELLVPAVLAMARRHLDAGLAGDWQEWALTGNERKDAT